MIKKLGIVLGAVVLLVAMAACLISFRFGGRRREAQSLTYSQESLTSRCSQQLKNAGTNFLFIRKRLTKPSPSAVF